MKKIFTLMMLAAAVAACTLPEDLTPDQPETPQIYTMTIKAAKGVDTKALYFSDDGKQLNAKWVDGEEVAVKEGNEKLGTLTAYPDPTDPAKATLKGSLEKAPSASGVELTLEFNSATYGGQDGTLGYIAKKCDYAKATTTITVEGNTITGTDASFMNQNAITKFTLKNGSTELKPSTVIVTAEAPNPYNYGPSAIEIHTYTYNIPEKTYTTNGGKFLYFAMPTVSGILDSKGLPSFAYLVDAQTIVLTITATVDGETYTYTKTGYPFEAGKYYDITVNMTKQYRTMDKATTNDIGKVIGADGKIYINAAEATTASTTAEAMIAYVGEVDGVCDHGLAIDLYDYSTSDNNGTYTNFDYETADSYASSKSKIAESTWRLPTVADWQYMLAGNTSATEFSNISGFQTLLNAVGNALADNAYYWTSTSVDSEKHKILYQYNHAASIQESQNTEYWRVRGCLAF